LWVSFPLLCLRHDDVPFDESLFFLPLFVLTHFFRGLWVLPTPFSPALLEKFFWISEVQNSSQLPFSTRLPFQLWLATAASFPLDLILFHTDPNEFDWRGARFPIFFSCLIFFSYPHPLVTKTFSWVILMLSLVS